MHCWGDRVNDGEIISPSLESAERTKRWGNEAVIRIRIFEATTKRPLLASLSSDLDPEDALVPLCNYSQ